MNKITERSRMIFDIPPDVQMAIKLRAVKMGVTTGEVVTLAVHLAFPEEVKEATAAIEELRKISFKFSHE